MWTEPTKNGKIRFVERYLDPLTEKHRKVSIVMDKDNRANRRIAQEALQDKINNKIGDSAPYLKKDSMTLEELTTLYSKYQEHTVALSTWSRNCFTIRTILKLLGPNTIAKNLTAGFVKAQFSSDTKNPGTINERYKRFKAIIRWAYANDYLSDIRYLDKITTLKNTDKIAKLQNKFLESDELALLLKGMKNENWRDLTHFLALSGLRCGEAIALDISDIDFKNKIISVNKTYDTIHHIVTDPKTLDSNREVYMQPELEELCNEIYRKNLRKKVNTGSKSKLFFCDIDGNYYEYPAYNKYLKENAKAILNRDNVTTHVLRHTHTSLMAEKGVPLDVISRRLGHKNSAVTRNIYFHVTKVQKELDNQAVAKVTLL